MVPRQTMRIDLPLGAFNVLKFLIISMVLTPLIEESYRYLNVSSTKRRENRVQQPVRWVESRLAHLCLHGKWYSLGSRVTLYLGGILITGVSLTGEFGFDVWLKDELASGFANNRGPAGAYSHMGLICEKLSNGSRGIFPVEFPVKDEQPPPRKLERCEPYSEHRLDGRVDWVLTSRYYGINRLEIVREGVEGGVLPVKCTPELLGTHHRTWVGHYRQKGHIQLPLPNGTSIRLDDRKNIVVNVSIDIHFTCRHEEAVRWRTTAYNAAAALPRTTSMEFSPAWRNMYLHTNNKSCSLTNNRKNATGVCLELINSSDLYTIRAERFSAVGSKKDNYEYQRFDIAMLGTGFNITVNRKLDPNILLQYLALPGSYLYDDKGAGAEGTERELGFLAQRAATGVLLGEVVLTNTSLQTYITRYSERPTITRVGIIAYGALTLMGLLLLTAACTVRLYKGRSNYGDRVIIRDTFEYVVDLWAQNLRNAETDCANPPTSGFGIGVAEDERCIQRIQITDQATLFRPKIRSSMDFISNGR